jgi:hypothetical protein
MAEPEQDGKDEGKDGGKGKPKGWLDIKWLRALLIWGGIGIFLLFFGGIAAQGYMRLVTPCSVDSPCPSPFIDQRILLGLVYLSVGGGIALGLVGVALTLSNPRGVGWALGMVVVGTVLFLVFVWPTPYKYYRVQEQKEQRLIRVHRVTGDSDYVPRSRPPEAAAASASQK